MRIHFLATLPLVVVLLAIVVAAQDQRLTGDQIIEKHLAAVGGRETLAKLKTRIALGTIRKEEEPENQLVILSESPNRLSAFYAFRDYDFHMIYDGSRALVRPVLPRNVSTITDKYQEMLGSGLMFNGISLYNLIANNPTSELKLEAKGLKKVGGKQAYVVQLKTQKGATAKLYFDAETFMWVRTDYGSASVSSQMGTFTNAIVPQGGSETTVDFYVETSDFREADGVKLPFKFTQVITYPILRQSAVGTIVGTIREYRHNELIDPKMFQ